MHQQNTHGHTGSPSPARITSHACSLLALFLFGLSAQCQQSNEETLRQRREDMVRTQIASPSWAPGMGVRDPRVLEAMRQTPRHKFVPEALIPNAYEDRPLPIGLGQTISQPYIVAKMTELLEPKRNDRALEIGTGSGYQAAVLSQLVRDVYTIEIVEPLGTQARQRFDRLGYRNIQSRVGDGYHGWKEAAPFDCIIVTAAWGEVPPPLLEQLAPGGRLVMPVGNPGEAQKLMLLTKGRKPPFSITRREIMPVAFVPLTGDRGKQPD